MALHTELPYDLFEKIAMTFYEKIEIGGEDEEISSLKNTETLIQICSTNRSMGLRLKAQLPKQVFTWSTRRENGNFLKEYIWQNATYHKKLYLFAEEDRGTAMVQIRNLRITIRLNGICIAKFKMETEEDDLGWLWITDFERLSDFMTPKAVQGLSDVLGSLVDIKSVDDEDDHLICKWAGFIYTQNEIYQE
jgi:hypothetical protein